MDDRLIDGCGGTMPFSVSGMDTRKRKPRSGKRPASPALAQAGSDGRNCGYRWVES